MLGTHRREVQVKTSLMTFSRLLEEGSSSNLEEVIIKEPKDYLISFFHPGGRTYLGAGGRADEARQGKRFCFHDREAGKARGACQVEESNDF